MLQRINARIEALFRLAGGLLFGLFILVIFFQVFSRNFISMSFVWTDEVAMFCFVWTVFIGAAVAYRHGLHYVVEVLPARFETATRVMKLLALAFGFPLIAVMIFGGYDYAQMGWRRFSFSLGMPLFYQNVAVPLAGTAMALFTLEIALRDLRALFRRDGTCASATASAGREGDIRQ